MTNTERIRIVAGGSRSCNRRRRCPENIARICRYVGISPKTCYKWKRALRRARCCLPESIETVTVVRGGLESGRPSQTFAGYKLFVTAGRVIP